MLEIESVFNGGFFTETGQGSGRVGSENKGLAKQVVETNSPDEPSHESRSKSEMTSADQSNLARSEPSIEDLRAKLDEKDEEIKALHAELHRLRLFRFGLFPFVVARRILDQYRVTFGPRLGQLYHHPPRPMRLSEAGSDGGTLSLEDLPAISLVTPSFQQGRYIARTLDSVLSQEYPDLEYFVQDGGSEDETVDILETYGERLAGWQSGSDEGQAHAINMGFANTRNDVMAWLNSDDLLLPGTLKTVGEFFARNPDVDVVYGNRLLIDEDDQQIGCWVLPGHDADVLSWADYVPQETLFWRRSIWEKVGGGVDQSFRFAMDWDLLLRFREAGARFAHIPRFLGAFRIHESQKSSAEIDEIGIKEMNRIRQRIHGRIPGNAEVHKAIAPYLLRHVGHHLALRVRQVVTGKA